MVERRAWGWALVDSKAGIIRFQRWSSCVRLWLWLWRGMCIFCEPHALSLSLSFPAYPMNSHQHSWSIEALVEESLERESKLRNAQQSSTRDHGLGTGTENHYAEGGGKQSGPTRSTSHLNERCLPPAMLSITSQTNYRCTYPGPPPFMVKKEGLVAPKRGYKGEQQ